MPEEETKEDGGKPAVEFIEAPGDTKGFESMFPSSDEPENDFGFGDDDDDDGEEENDDPKAPEQDPAVDARIAALEATNRTLQENYAKIQSANQDTLIAELHNKYADAIKYGETDNAAAIKKQLDEAYRVGVAAAAPAPAPVTNTELQTKAKAWLDRQDWYGKDAAKTKKLNDIASVLDPSKFATPEDYISEVERQVVGEETPNTPTPLPNSRATPAPRPKGSGGSQMNDGAIKSIKELRGDRRKAAETAIRVGGLSEKAYVDNYNAVVKSAKARKGRRK